jgi:hypothetical protein
MEFGPARALALAMLVLAMGAVAGCGGSASSSTESSTSSARGSTAPAAGFSKKAKPASFGEEASEEERSQASETLERNMSARAAGNFEVQCETLAAPVVEAIEEGGSGAVGKKSCAETLESEAKKAPPGLLANNLVGPIAALRVKGNRGYAVYHGKENNDYAMRMEKENGEWKVAATLTETLPKG